VKTMSAENRGMRLRMGLRLIDIVVELRRRHLLKPAPSAIRRFPVGHHGPCRAVVDAGLSA
jgi:hypothetical protein